MNELNVEHSATWWLLGRKMLSLFVISEPGGVKVNVKFYFDNYFNTYRKPSFKVGRERNFWTQPWLDPVIAIQWAEEPITTIQNESLLNGLGSKLKILYCIKFLTYSKTNSYSTMLLRRPPSTALDQTTSIPPTALVPKKKTVMTAPNVMVNWRVSVHTTALRPPIVV